MMYLHITFMRKYTKRWFDRNLIWIRSLKKNCEIRCISYPKTTLSGETLSSESDESSYEYFARRKIRPRKFRQKGFLTLISISIWLLRRLPLPLAVNSYHQNQTILTKNNRNGDPNADFASTMILKMCINIFLRMC